MCSAMGVHRVWDAHEALDMDEAPNEGVASENDEKLTHLYPKSGAGNGDMRCVCDALRERTTGDDAASEYAQRGATHEDTEACDDAETTDGYTSPDNADTCEKGMGYEVSIE